MESTRLQKVARQIQKDIAEIFIREGAPIVAGTMVSVTKVRMSPDLSLARVYISVFPFDKSAEKLENINKNMSQIRKALGNRTKLQLRIVPELVFAIDDSLEYIANIDRLLK